MAYYEAQLVTRRFPQWMDPAHLAVDVGAGSLLIEAQVGENWITVEDIIEDTVKQMDVANGKFRFTPADGAVFEFAVGNN